MNEKSLVEQFSSDGMSPYRRYLRTFVGEESFAALLRYELLTGLLGPMPGAVGLFLRARCYRHLLGRLGRGSFIGRSVVFRSPGRIALGDNVVVDDQAVLDAKGESSTIELGNSILLGRLTILSCNDARIRIGNFVSIGPFCHVASRSHVDIGSNVGIGADVHIIAGGHRHDDPSVPVILQTRVSHGIVIGDNCWIGVGARILDGVTIGNDCIVGAGAVVGKDVPPWTTVLGNPARVVENRARRQPAPA